MSSKILHFQLPLTEIKGIGESSLQKLKRLNLATVGDLIRFLPTRYIDFTKQITISELKDKKAASFLAKISFNKSFYTKSGRLMLQATAKDQTGSVILTWFNNPYIKKLIKDDTEYTIAGTPSYFSGKLTLISPTIEEGNSFSLNTQGLVPIYPLTAGITSRWLRQKIYLALESLTLSDPLDATLLKSQNLPKLQDAYFHIHFPQNKIRKLASDKRLSFNQHLAINITNQLNRKGLGKSPKITINQQVHLQSLQKLPFTLTSDQQKIIHSLYQDLSSDNYSHRLIQGDTGSGKTATIILAANQCLSQNLSCALIAPTQILATQHYETFQKFLLNGKQAHLVLGHSVATLPTDKPYIYIGTHALLTKLPALLSHPLAFLAIDEQHKFGVNQREQLQNRRPLPHLINLSATPIPRTVALGLLGDIELSNIKFQPQNRLPIKTYVLSASYFKKSTSWLTSHLQKGHQVYVVCPHIHNSQTETASVESLSTHYRSLLPSQTPIFTLHGQLKPTDQQKILSTFKATKGSLLVSTSLIEVGIDIPSATIMIIHSAERFGLAQLHQLRGRVGRGEEQSYCFLVPSTDDQVEKERLQLLQKYSNGLTLAKKDLLLRGAGEVFGEKQHGALQTKLTYFWSKKSFLKAKKLALHLIKANPLLAKDIATSLNNC